jgi:hypothetical protein
VKTRQILERAHLARLGDGRLTIAQRSLICSDIKGLPETDEVEELLFTIQDLLVPFLPEDYPDWRDEEDRRPIGSVCYIRDCTDPVLVKGLCKKHYKALRNAS